MPTCPNCGTVFTETPPTDIKPFPGTILFEATSSQGTGAYKGTACILFAQVWEGKIISVTMNGEKCQKGVSYKGQPVFRLLKTGDKYTRPLSLTIETTTGIYSLSISADAPPVIPSGDAPTLAGHSILWKPVADSGGDLVVLTHRSYGKTTVRVLDMNKNVIETGTFAYYSNPDRATYRFKRSGGEFPKPCLLQVGSKLFTVPDGSKRYE